MRDVIQVDPGRLRHRGFAGLHEQLGGFGGKDFVADLRAGAQDPVGFGIEELRILRMGIKAELSNGGVPGVDGC